MSDIICECGHSIEEHSNGYYSGVGTPYGTTMIYDICKLSRDTVEARHQLAQMTAERDHWQRTYETEEKMRILDLAERDALAKKLEVATDNLEKIDNWTKAYPLDIFPVPDLEKARKLLADGGITLDAISATAMRHVITRVGKYATIALAEIARMEAQDE